MMLRGVARLAETLADSLHAPEDGEDEPPHTNYGLQR
jgi:hypothetical protein